MLHFKIITCYIFCCLTVTRVESAKTQAPNDSVLAELIDDPVEMADRYIRLLITVNKGVDPSNPPVKEVKKKTRKFSQEFNNQSFGEYDYENLWDKTLAVVVFDNQSDYKSKVNRKKHLINVEYDDPEDGDVQEFDKNHRISKNNVPTVLLKLMKRLYRKGKKYQPSQLIMSDHENDNQHSLQNTQPEETTYDENEKGFTPLTDILRKWGSCYKQARKYCKKACKNAFKAFCESYYCTSKMKSKFKREIDKACRDQF